MTNSNASNFFYCYSKRMKMFFYENGVKLHSFYRLKGSHRPVWVYERTETLDHYCKLWNSLKEA